MPPIRSHEETYRVLKDWSEKEIELLRDSLENPKLTDEKTTFKRGEIARLRKLLKKMEEEAHV